MTKNELFKFWCIKNGKKYLAIAVLIGSCEACAVIANAFTNGPFFCMWSHNYIQTVIFLMCALWC